MGDPLTELLYAMARFELDDHSLCAEAADVIKRLRNRHTEVRGQYIDAQQWCLKATELLDIVNGTVEPCPICSTFPHLSGCALAKFLAEVPRA